jgi:hypothetical protein
MSRPKMNHPACSGNFFVLVDLARFRGRFLVTVWNSDVTSPYLVFLLKADPGAPSVRRSNPFGPCDLEDMYYSIARIDGTPYGGQAAFEERYLSLTEREGKAAINNGLYFVMDESAIGRFHARSKHSWGYTAGSARQ